MDAEKIRERMKMLEAKRDQCLADANAFEGAINDCKFWLAELAKAERTAKAETNGKTELELVRG